MSSWRNSKEASEERRRNRPAVQLTPEMAQRIHALVLSGKTYGQAGRIVGISKGRVCSVMMRLRRGEPVGAAAVAGMPEDDIAALKAFAEEGASVETMAKALHYSHDTIRKQLYKILGQPYRRPKELARLTRLASLERREVIEGPPRRRNDDMKHCLAILAADDPHSPPGCGFPVCQTQARAAA